jgi:hypothetical protein
MDAIPAVAGKDPAHSPVVEGALQRTSPAVSGDIEFA